MLIGTTTPDVPVARGRLPVIGHASAMLRRPLPFVDSLRAQGDVVKIYMGRKPVYMLTDARLAITLTRMRDEALTRESLTQPVRILFGDAVAALSGRAHRERRLLLAPSFRRARLIQNAEVMTRVAGEHAGSWRPGQRLQFDAVTFDITLATLTGSLFSSDLGAAAAEEIRRSLPSVLKALPKRVMKPAFLLTLPMPANRRFEATAQRLRGHLAELVAAYRRGGSDRGDMLSAMLLHRDPETGAALTDREIVDELIGMVVAGADTPGSMLAWVFHELARHPEAERRLHAEIAEVAPEGPVRFEQVPALTYTRQVVQETLRLYSPWINLQDAEIDMTIGGVALSAGSTIGFSLYMLHRDPRVFEHPNRFDPDRWSPGRVEAISDASMLFSMGRRKCPGEAFSLAQLTTQVATIAQRWQLRPAPGSRPVAIDTRSVALGPSAMPMIVEPRG